jgi:hypothetical protein
MFWIRSFRTVICWGLISRERRLATMFKLAPQERRWAAARKSSWVVDANVNEPVSSYMPRLIMVASSAVMDMPLSRKRWVRMLTVAP